MNMDVSGQQSTSSQSLKLPIPRLSTTSLLTPNTKFPDMLIPNNWTQQTQLPITLPTTCQPMLTSTSSMGKPAQNKRGRKPLSKMPETKKHIQNLTNQRAFRRRREDYVRTLETKAATYELLYNEAQNDIKMLRDRLTLLERRLNKAQTQGNRNDKLCNTSVYQESDTPGDTTMNNCTYDGNRLSAITPNTMSSFSFNEQRYQQKPGSPTKSVESVEDIINNPVFCETKEGDLCFCETVEFSVDNMEKEQSQLAPTGRCYIDHKEGKRMWIIPKKSISQYSCNDSSQTSRECCPTLPLPEQSQWPSQQPHENYLPSPSPIEPSPPNYTQHHPLNLGLILGDHHSDESSDDSA